MKQTAQQHFTSILTGTVIAVVLVIPFFTFSPKANAVAGINRTINFQGKLVSNPAKTNVSNTSYTVVFTFYDRATGGTVLWQETQTVTTADGIFRVNLGSVTPIPSNFNFNWDGVYLGMKVNADSEMTPRIQMAAVPYAFNAEKVSGLTVQDSSGNASTSGTLRIANNKTINLGTDNLTFTTGGDTTLTLPSTGTLSTLAGNEILTNKTIGSTGLIFSGAATDITTATDEDLTLSPNGSGNLILGGDSDSSVTIGTATTKEFPLLVRSGISNLASFVVDNLNSGNLFSASSAGTTKFTIGANGEIGLGLLAGLPNFGSSNNCLISNGTGTGASWSTCAAGANLWQLNGNVISQNNNTYDVLFGSNATSTARFAFIGNAGNATPVASISAQNGTSNSTYLSAIGNLATTNKQTLSLGGITTGLINILNSAGNIFSTFDTLNSRFGIGTSAPLAALDVNGTASVGGTLTFYSTPQIQSTARQTLTLGGSTTGSIQFNPGGLSNPNLYLKQNGDIGINNTNPLASFDIRANTANNGGTIPVASVAGATSFASLVVNNSGVGDIFAASKSGATKFVIKNDGTIGFGDANYTSCDTLSTDSSALLSCGVAGSSVGDTLLAVYVISSHAGLNLTVNFSGAANSAPASSSGTITFPSNASKMTVEARAGGGGGGGTGGATAIKNAGGGGEGGYSREFLSSLSSTYYVKVGGGGNGGAAGGINAGAQGTSTCFGTNASDACSGAMINTAGGLGGAGINSAVTAAGGNGGSATGGDLNIQGQSGFASAAVATSNFSGAGGGAGGGRQVTVAGADGNSGSSGGGGSGAGGITSAATTRAGGRGGDGYIVFYIYKSGDQSLAGWNQFASGVLAPDILTTDVLIGGNSTESAKFGFLNVAGGIPTASISAGIGNFATYLTGDGTLSTTNNSTLTLGGGATGNVQINPLGGALFSIGTSNPLASIDLRYSSGTNRGGITAVASVSGTTSFASLVVNNSGVGDLFAASKSGATKFAVNNNGNLQFAGTTNSLSTIASAATASRTWTLPDATGTVCLTTTCAAGINLLQLNSNVISQNNNTYDVMFGGTATATAKFAFIGNAGSATPIASISATTASSGNGNGLVFDSGSSSIQSLRRNTLTVGGNTTGSIQFSAGGNSTLFIKANGDIGAGTNNIDPRSSFDIRSNTGNSGGTISVASVSGTTSFAALLIDQRGAGDIFTASTAGVPRFSITNAGGFKIGELQGSLGECLKSGGAGASLSWGACGGSGAAGTWTLNSLNGTHTPINNTADLLIGGISTSSALFKVTGLSSALSNLSVGIGSMTSPTGLLNVEGAYTGKALAIFNQLGNQDIFTASTSGTPRFALGANGEIKVGSGGNLSSGISGQCLISAGNGATVNWGGCASGAGAGWWTLQSAQGTVYPVNATLDMLVGGTSTSAAKFAFTGSAGSANPIASFSATTVSNGNGNGLSFDSSNSTIQSLRRNSLTIGGNTTGSIQFIAGGNSTLFLKANGDIGTGTNNNDPKASFDIRSNTANGGGTVAVASVSGKTSFAALVVNNSGTGDLIAASTGGQTRFKITNNGSVMLGGDFIAASNTAKLTNNGSPATINALGDQNSLVPNASFEVATGSGAISNDFEFAAGWVVSATTSGTVRVDNSTSSHGDRSIKVQFTNNRSAIYSACFPVNAVDTNDGYNINYNYRYTAAPVPTVRMGLSYYNSKANCNNNTSALHTAPFSTAALGAASANWQQVAGAAVTLTAQNARWARVNIFVACTTNCTNATIWLDAVRVSMQSLTASGLDLAENYTGDPENLAEPGDVVKLVKRDGKSIVVPADSVYGKDVIGVVTTKPGLVLDDEMDSPKVPVVLAGRIPVKVSTVNGKIKVGDKLTSSSIPGVAIKAIKSGQIIGTAMEDYDSDEIGQIVVHFSLQNNSGSISDSFENVSLESNSFGEEVLNELKNQENQGLSGSEIVTDRLIASVEIVTPKLTVDTLHAKKIIVDEIEGLTSINSRLADLEAKVATMSATQSSDSTLNVSVEYATISSQLSENNIKLEQQNKLMQMISEQLASSSANTTSSSLVAIETPTFTDNLRIKGNALIEGVVNVVDSIITNNIIVNGLATFFGDVIFKSNATFEGPVTFSSDMGGSVVIEKEKDKAEIKFNKEFEELPLLNASVSFEEQKDEEGNVIPSDELQKDYFKEKYEYIIVNKSKKGFDIVLNKKALTDLTFTWTAIRVKDPINIQSRKPD